MKTNDLTQQIIGGAIEVQRHLGPGLLENAYEECLCHELKLRGLEFRRQVELPVQYKGVYLDCGYRMDIVVENLVVLELKAVEKMLPIFDAQLLTYLKLADLRLGLLLNFCSATMTQGLTRIANDFQED